jgi:hypothetical protein
MALPDVDAQIGDPLGVPTILAQRAGTQGAPGAGDGFVDRVFHHRADSTGEKLRGPGPVERIIVDLTCGRGQDRITGGERGIHRAKVRQRVRVSRLACGAPV